MYQSFPWGIQWLLFTEAHWVHFSASEIEHHIISLIIPFHVLAFHYLYGMMHIFDWKLH